MLEKDRNAEMFTVCNDERALSLTVWLNSNPRSPKVVIPECYLHPELLSTHHDVLSVLTTFPHPCCLTHCTLRSTVWKKTEGAQMGIKLPLFDVVSSSFTK